MKDKTKIRLYYIFTFGIGYLIAKKKAKQIANQVNSELTVSEKIPFDLDKLISLLGGKENITSVDATINSLKVSVKDIEKINQKEIKTLGAKGTILSEDSVTCLFGDYSKKLSEILNENIKN
ncbi:MAG: PTS transporter subunit EIIB [Malacoplasma sp.]|nr:PTS transporter subunit EIIB [Malacoplasma sp.]